MVALSQSVLRFVRAKELARAGQRVAVAVSGGADSVALLRVLLELRGELGIVIKVAHFNHCLRGAESDADEQFVRRLAARFDLEFHAAQGETRALAQQDKLSVETAARQLRYDFLRGLIAQGVADRVATAHHLDDQAETLLLRLLRGAGMKGMRGVHALTGEGIIRPMLNVRRAEIEAYLRALGQEWREDASNDDPRHLRNRIRRQLLPLLARDYNPAIAETLARTAELLAADEETLAAETERLLPLALLPGQPVRGGGRAVRDDSMALAAERLSAQPLALQRRLVRAAAERLGLQLDMQQVESALALPVNGKLQLGPRWQVRRAARELRFEPRAGKQPGYAYPLAVPGEARIEEMNIVVRARVMPLDSPDSRGTLDGTLSPSAVLVVRNWRAGDRYRQAYAAREHKVKELLDEVDPPAEQRPQWPVIAADGAVVWVRGARNRELQTSSGARVVIEIEELD